MILHGYRKLQDAPRPAMVSAASPRSWCRRLQSPQAVGWGCTGSGTRPWSHHGNSSGVAALPAAPRGSGTWCHWKTGGGTGSQSCRFSRNTPALLSGIQIRRWVRCGTVCTVWKHASWVLGRGVGLRHNKVTNCKGGGVRIGRSLSLV